MKTTLTLSNNLNCNLFELLNQDVDEVIMIINYYIALRDDVEYTNTNKNNGTAGHNDGFWDM